MPNKTIKEKLLKPIKLSPIQRKISNALISRSKEVSILLEGLKQKITIEFLLEDTLPLKEYTIFLYISLFDKPCILAMDSWPLEENLDSFLSGEKLESLPKELSLATIEASHESLINIIETALDSEIKLYKYSNEFNGNTDEWLSLKITGDDKHVSNAKLILNNHIINELVEAISILPIEKDQSIPAITIPIYMEYGRTKINKSLISSIELGDVLLVDSTNSLDKNNTHIRLTNMKKYLARNTTDSKKYLFQEEVHMKNNESETETSINLNDLPLTVTFDLGKTSLPLSELEKLGEGYTLDLSDVSLDELVTLRIENQLLGKGELVEIADRIGVRITQLSLPKGNHRD